MRHAGTKTESLSIDEARRLALVRGGLLRPERTGLPERAGTQPRRACYAVLGRFGYLQLDTIGVAGARSHALVLSSRLPDLARSLPETLLRPKAPLFEYWGHEASWLPMALYPVFEFRRREFRRGNPWWGPLLVDNRDLARRIMKRVEREGPLKVKDLEDRSRRNDWGYTPSKRVLRCLWWAGSLAVVRRHRFQPEYDLTERVIPKDQRDKRIAEDDAIKTLLLRALDGHGWARTSTLASTWRLSNRRPQITQCLEELREEGEIIACASGGKAGWIRLRDLELSAGLGRLRPRSDRGVLLSPFDPLLWDRARVRSLFGFDHVLEIFKPERERVYGYYVMPVLAGDRLTARCDVKADRNEGKLRVLAVHHEGRPNRAALLHALERHAASVELTLDLGTARSLR